MAGLEPARLAPPPPQDGVSTNSTTSARTERPRITLSIRVPKSRDPELSRGAGSSRRRRRPASRVYSPSQRVGPEGVGGWAIRITLRRWEHGVASPSMPRYASRPRTGRARKAGAKDGPAGRAEDATPATDCARPILVRASAGHSRPSAGDRDGPCLPRRGGSVSSIGSPTPTAGSRNGKGGRWAQRPVQKKATGSSRPGRLNGRRRRGSGRLLEGNHAAQTALAFALRHVPQRLEERAVVAVFDVAAHGVDHLGADIG